MVDSNLGHEAEARFRNIEAHLGIGHTDEDSGEYTVDQHEEVAAKPETEEETHSE
jgi:hypothetical protein